MGRLKQTSSKVAGKAAKVLKSNSTGASSKKVAGSALSQKGAPQKVTSKNVASVASKVLQDGRTSKASKSAAGSALSQRQGKGKK
ncbi:MAG: hypothetical protein NT166_06875 [Candidatus Aminicenantes bacterium]|nr:hypothetical protein [Candidatus Aminicenantes bacterium]